MCDHKNQVVFKVRERLEAPTLASRNISWGHKPWELGVGYMAVLQLLALLDYSLLFI